MLDCWLSPHYTEVVGLTYFWICYCFRIGNQGFPRSHPLTLVTLDTIFSALILSKGNSIPSTKPILYSTQILFGFPGRSFLPVALEVDHLRFEGLLFQVAVQ